MSFRMMSSSLDAYLEAVELAFGSDVHYAQMTPEFGQGTAWVKSALIQGRMAKPEITTRRIERQNLRLRNFVRRLNRKTLCFSMKLENLRSALALHFFWYNFGRIHRSLRCTPAMEAGLADSVRLV